MPWCYRPNTLAVSKPVLRALGALDIAMPAFSRLSKSSLRRCYDISDNPHTLLWHDRFFRQREVDRSIHIGRDIYTATVAPPYSDARTQAIPLPVKGDCSIGVGLRNSQCGGVTREERHYRLRAVFRVGETPNSPVVHHRATASGWGFTGSAP